MEQNRGKEDIRRFMDGDTRFLSLDARIETMRLARACLDLDMGDIPEDGFQFEL